MSQYNVLQLEVGNMQNFSYLVYSGSDALVIDTSFGGAKLHEQIKRHNLNLRYILSTHNHFDHNMDNGFLKHLTNAKIVAHALSPVDKDIAVEDGSKLVLADLTVDVIYTPGHTKDSVCYLLQNECLFTGDTLFIGTCGRVDLPDSNPKDMFNSLRRICTLKKGIVIYPGHDYGATKTSTVQRECSTNPAIALNSLEDFIQYAL
ncbi:MAG: MBL fold metallo-hydrolase [Conexivisphaerales archaeon]